MLCFTLLIGAFSIFVLKKNFLMYFISLELIVLAINLEFIFASLDIKDSRGLFIAVILLAIAAIDTAIGLSLLIKYYNITGRIDVSSMTVAKT
jgi:NADH-quinone oxidoreductase subunit K